MNRLGVIHECDGRTDGRTDIAIAHAALHYFTWTETFSEEFPTSSEYCSEKSLIFPTIVSTNRSIGSTAVEQPVASVHGW